DGSLATSGRLLERDLDRVFDILAAFAGDGPSARPLEIEAGKAAGLAGEEGVEEVAEVTDAGGTRSPACLRLILAGEHLRPPRVVPNRTRGGGTFSVYFCTPYIRSLLTS